jgi:hypothetical protein
MNGVAKLLRRLLRRTILTENDFASLQTMQDEKMHQLAKDLSPHLAGSAFAC